MMSNIKAEFTVYWRQSDPDPEQQLWVKVSTLRTTDRNLFSALKLNAARVRDRDTNARADFSVPYPSDDFNAIRLTLKEYGVEIVEPYAKIGSWCGKLFPHYQRNFTEIELDDFPLFTVGHTTSIIAEYHARDTNENLVVEAGTVKREVDFGKLAPFSAIAFSSKLKDSVERLGLETGFFREIYDTQHKPSGLWQLWSDVLLPECLLPRINGSFQVVEDQNESAFFFDGGYIPQILRFDQKKTESLGDFGVAVMQERWGPFGVNSDRAIVLTRKVRKILESLNVAQIKFDPVELVVSPGCYAPVRL